MICMAHRYRAALPNSRNELIRDICEVLIARWRQQRGVADSYSTSLKLLVLRGLAAYMMDKRVNTIPEGDVLSIVAERLAEIGLMRTPGSAMELICDLRESTGIFLESAPGMWGFAHLVFQNYLCADAWIHGQPRSSLDWATLVRDPWWRETLLFYSAGAVDATFIGEALLESADANRGSFASDVLREARFISSATRSRLEQLVRDEGTKINPLYLES